MQAARPATLEIPAMRRARMAAAPRPQAGYARQQRQRQRQRQRPPPDATVIIETSAVVEVLRALHAGRRPPRWFEASRGEGRLAVPRTVEVELKRLRKLNRRGAGTRTELSWLARLGGRDLQWVYELYREAPIDARVLSEVERMHAEAAGDSGGDAARSWLRSKRAFARERLGHADAASLGGPRAGRALAALARAASNDRAIMAQAVAIASAAARRRTGGNAHAGGPPAAVLVSRDGDFTAFAGRLEEISGGAMAVARYSRM